MTKRIGKILFALIAFVGLATGGLLIWVTSNTGSAWISDKVRDAAEKEIGLIITFGKIDLEIFPPRLVLRNLEASDNKNRINAKAEEVELSPDPLALLSGDLRVEEIYLGSPLCTINLTTEDIDALLKQLSKDNASSSAKEKLDLSVIPSFEVIAVSDGKFDVTVSDPDRLGSGTLLIERVNFDITGGAKKIEVRSLIEKGHLDWKKSEDSISEDLTSLEFRAAITEDAVDVRHIFLEAAGAEIRGRDAHIPIPIWPRGPNITALSLSVPLNIFARLPLDLPPMWGMAGFNGQVSVQKKEDEDLEISARGKVSLEQGKIDDFVIGSLDGLIAMGSQGVSFSEINLNTAQGRLILDGNIAFDDALSTEVTARLDGIELANLLENLTLDGAWIKQKITGSIKAKGTLNPLRLDSSAKLGVSNFTVFDNGFRQSNKNVILHLADSSVAGRLNVTDKRLIAKNLNVRTGDTRVSVDLLFNFDKGGWELVARSDQLDLGDIKKIAGIDVAGRGKVMCRISDPIYGDPHIVGSGSFNKLSFAGFDFESVSMGVRFDDEDLIFDGLTVRSQRSLYSSREVKINLGGREGLRVEAKIDAEHVDITELAETLHVDITPYGSPRGTLYGRVAIDYRQRPESFHIEAKLQHDELQIFDEKFGSEELDFIWNDGQLTLNRLGLRKGRGLLSLTGAVMPSKEIDFIGYASDVSVEMIDHKEIKKLGVDAKAQIFAIIGGTLDHPTGQIDLRLSQARRGKKKYGASHLEVSLDGDVILGRGNLGGQMFALEYGKLDLGTKEFELEAFAYDIDLIDILSVDTMGSRTTVNVTGEIALQGRLDSKPRLTGETTLNKIEISINGFQFKNRVPLLITADNDRFKLDRSRFFGSDIIFDLSGKAGLERMNFAINGLADLKAVSNLVKPLRSCSGRLSFEGSATGAWSDPRLRGQADIKSGGFNVKGFPHRIENIEGHIVLGAKVAKFNNFSARTAGGTIDMNGHLTLKGLDIDDYEFNAHVHELDLNLMDDLSLNASTSKDGIQLKFDRKRRLPMVIGDVKISHLRYTQDLRAVQIKDLSVNQLTGTRTRVRKPRIYDAKKDIFAFDVRLHGEETDDLMVRNNIVDARLSIDDREEPLRLVGTNQIIGFLGRVHGTGGKVRYAGKSFDIRYAAVSFRDKLRPDNPHFRVTADGSVRDWKIAITAEGTVDDYTVTLSSQPYLSQEDIVLLLLTGMTKAELAQVGSSGFGGTITPFFDFGGELIPVEIRLYNEYSETAGTDTTRVSVEKQITEDIWAAISSSLGQEREIKAKVEYKLNDNFSVLIDFDNESQFGNLGIDLKYRLEF